VKRQAPPPPEPQQRLDRDRLCAALQVLPDRLVERVAVGLDGRLPDAVRDRGDGRDVLERIAPVRLLADLDLLAGHAAGDAAAQLHAAAEGDPGPVRLDRHLATADVDDGAAVRRRQPQKSVFTESLRF
jgi:hypothetical protein